MQGEHGGTVRIRIVRALERLRSQMARRGHGPGAEAAPLTRRAG